MNCTSYQSHLPDLLLEPEAPADTDLRSHLDSCTSCAEELAALQSTFALLDDWQTPEISPYFDQKMSVRLREEQAGPAAGWFERMKTYLLLNTGRQFRPALVGALALVLVVGGGSFGISNLAHTDKAPASATVNDLQILDRNEQALQQMDQLMQDDAPVEQGPAAPPQS